jgi:hypothetical protein
VVEDSVKVSWYGERGVVNAVISALVEAGVPGAIAFLNAVAWAERPEWLNDVRSVELIVEINCFEFGHPDLIVVCTTKDNNRFATFVEAKVIPYDLSAGSNRQGIRVRGFNSTINGQLSLKYRLALALSRWDGECDKLSESDSLYRAYKRPWSQLGLGDTIRWPRHLKKPNVLSLLRNAGLAGMPLSNFRFVAWTWDREPFFRTPAFDNSDQRPVFLDGDGNEQWQRMLPQLGWIGFKQIAESAKLQDFLGDEFRSAVNTMRESLEPAPVVDVTALNDLPGVTPYNILDNSDENTIQQLRAIEQLAASYFGEQSVEKGAGSSSISYAGKVMVKLVPRDHSLREYLMLGVSTSLGRDKWGGHSLGGPKKIGKGNNEQPFYTLDLPRTEKALEVASEVLLDVAEVCGIEIEGQ